MLRLCSEGQEETVLSPVAKTEYQLPGGLENNKRGFASPWHLLPPLSLRYTTLCLSASISSTVDNSIVADFSSLLIIPFLSLLIKPCDMFPITTTIEEQNGAISWTERVQLWLQNPLFVSKYLYYVISLNKYTNVYSVCISQEKWRKKNTAHSLIPPPNHI